MFRKDNSTNSDNQICLPLISLLIHVPDIDQECCVLTTVNGCLLIRWILIVLFCHHMTYHFRTLPLRSPRFVLIDQSFYSLSYSRTLVTIVRCTLCLLMILILQGLNGAIISGGSMRFFVSVMGWDGGKFIYLSLHLLFMVSLIFMGIRF